MNEGVPAPAELRARGTTAVPAGKTDRDLQGGSGVETRHGRRGGRHGEGQALDRRPREVDRAHAGVDTRVTAVSMASDTWFQRSGTCVERV